VVDSDTGTRAGSTRERGLEGYESDNAADEARGRETLEVESAIDEAGLESDDRGLTTDGKEFVEPASTNRGGGGADPDLVPSLGRDLVITREDAASLEIDGGGLAASVKGVEGESFPALFGVFLSDEEGNLSAASLEVVPIDLADSAGAEEQDFHKRSSGAGSGGALAGAGGGALRLGWSGAGKCLPGDVAAFDADPHEGRDGDGKDVDADPLARGHGEGVETPNDRMVSSKGLEDKALDGVKDKEQKEGLAVLALPLALVDQDKDAERDGGSP